MSPFEALRARLRALEQALETEAERLPMEFAERLAEGGDRLRATHRAVRMRLLP